MQDIYSFFVNIFAYLYDFFFYLVLIIQKPFNEFFSSVSFTNPFDGREVVMGLPDGVFTTVLNSINNFIISVLSPILNFVGLGVDSPVWQVYLILLPLLFLIIVFIKLFIQVFK